MDSPASILKSARLSARLSIRTLAARAGVAHSTVTRIESGRMDPTIGMLEHASSCRLGASFN
jgi:transcriptional regulator with XRE-family HTH domain